MRRNVVKNLWLALVVAASSDSLPIYAADSAPPDYCMYGGVKHYLGETLSSTEEGRGAFNTMVCSVRYIGGAYGVSPIKYYYWDPASWDSVAHISNGTLDGKTGEATCSYGGRQYHSGDTIEISPNNNKDLMFTQVCIEDYSTTPAGLPIVKLHWKSS